MVVASPGFTLDILDDVCFSLEQVGAQMMY